MTRAIWVININIFHYKMGGLERENGIIESGKYKSEWKGYKIDKVKIKQCEIESNKGPLFLILIKILLFLGFLKKWY